MKRMKNKPDTQAKVVYESMEQAMRPLEPAILKAFDFIYNLSEGDSLELMDEKHVLSELLGIAGDVAFEIEIHKKFGDN